MLRAGLLWTVIVAVLSVARRQRPSTDREPKTLDFVGTALSWRVAGGSRNSRSDAISVSRRVLR